jgi:hypothetical protein
MFQSVPNKHTQTPCWWFSIHAWDDPQRIVSGDWNMLKPYFWDRTKADWRRAFQKKNGAEFWLTCKKQKENKSNYPYRTNELTTSQVIVHDCLHGCVFIWYWGTGSNHLEIKYDMLIEPLKGKCQCLCAAWDRCRRLLPRPSREVDDFDQRRRREEQGNWAPTASGHGSESPESSWGCHGESNHR